MPMVRALHRNLGSGGKSGKWPTEQVGGWSVSPLPQCVEPRGVRCPGFCSILAQLTRHRGPGGSRNTPRVTLPGELAVTKHFTADGHTADVTFPGTMPHEYITPASFTIS